MSKQDSKEQLLKDIRTERRRLEKNLFILSQDDMIQPNVTGNWSVKDILAHLIAWEKLFLEWYSAGKEGVDPDTTPVGMSKNKIDAINQQIYENNKERSLHQILSEFQTSFQRILSVIEAIPEDDLFVRGRFSWTSSLTLADYVAGNTCNHYAWAKSQIRKYIRC